MKFSSNHNKPRAEMFTLGGEKKDTMKLIIGSISSARGERREAAGSLSALLQEQRFLGLKAVEKKCVRCKGNFSFLKDANVPFSYQISHSGGIVYTGAKDSERVFHYRNNGECILLLCGKQK